jgi:hypothetical protein
MIKNERQFRITKAQADNFRRAIAAIETRAESDKRDPILRKAELDALRSQLSDLEEEITEYEQLRSGQADAVRVESFRGRSECVGASADRRRHDARAVSRSTEG